MLCLMIPEPEAIFTHAGAYKIGDFAVRGVGDAKGIWSILKTSQEAITEQLLTQLADELDKTSAGQGDCLSALRAYKASITPEMQRRLQNGELIKMLTIYSDGMVYCLACGKENHDYQVDVEILRLIKEEVQALREMGVIVQGIGFTKRRRLSRLSALILKIRMPL